MSTCAWFCVKLDFIKKTKNMKRNLYEWSVDTLTFCWWYWTIVFETRQVCHARFIADTVHLSWIQSVIFFCIQINPGFMIMDCHEFTLWTLSGPEYWPEVTVWAIYNPIYIIVGCLHSNNTNCSIAISQNITFKLLRGIYFSMFFHWSLIPPLIRGSKSEQSPEKACIEASQMEYGKFKDHFSTIDIR